MAPLLFFFFILFAAKETEPPKKVYFLSRCSFLLKIKEPLQHKPFKFNNPPSLPPHLHNTQQGYPFIHIFLKKKFTPQNNLSI